jgi:SNF2 family DNA or RNA helicase
MTANELEILKLAEKYNRSKDKQRYNKLRSKFGNDIAKKIVAKAKQLAKQAKGNGQTKQKQKTQSKQQGKGKGQTKPKQQKGQTKPKQSLKQGQRMLAQTQGFLFKTQGMSAKPQDFKKKFSAQEQKTLALLLSKYRDQLEQIKPGYPIFEIEGYRFTLGTADMPGYNAKTMPTDKTSARVYFDKIGLDALQMDREDIGEELGLDLAFIDEMKYHTPPRIGKEWKNPNLSEAQRQKVKKQLIINKLKKEKRKFVVGGRWKAAKTQAQKNALVNSELVKANYRFSFNLDKLIEFIDSIQETLPVAAYALQKVYFSGAVTGVDMSACPEVFEIEKISRKGKKKLTSSEKKLIEQFVGPLAKYKTKKSKFSFRLFQLIGIAFWRAAGGRAMIADQQGIGKTAQGMGCLKLALLDKKLPNPIPALIVTPRNTLENWKRELEEWAPEVTPIKVTGGDLRNWRKLLPKGAKNPVVITTYTSAAQNVTPLLADDFKFIIMDESQMIRNAEAKRTKALFRLAQRAKMVVLLTGSPIEKSEEDLYAQMRMVRPDKFNNVSAFMGSLKEVYYNPQKGELGLKLPHTVNLYGKNSITTEYDIWSGKNYVMRPELSKSSGEVADGLKCFMIRRLKNDVLDLPPKSRNVVTLQYPKELQMYYDSLKENIMQAEAARVVKKWADETSEKIIEQMKKGKTKKQAEIVARQLMKEDREKVERMTSGKKIGFQIFNAMRRQSGLMKVPLVLEWVQDFFKQNPGEPLLIFAEHHNVINALRDGISKMKRRDPRSKKERKVRVETYTGKTSNAKRDQMVDDFQSGKVDVMIINKAGNKGMNLTRASYVLFAERYWNASDEEQAEDRAHRATSKNPVFIYYFEVDSWGTTEPIDNELAKIVEDKRKIMERFVGNQRYERNEQTSKVPKWLADKLDKELKAKINLAANMQVALQQALKQKRKKK